MFEKLLPKSTRDWLELADLKAAREAETAMIIQRLSRGNTSLQNSGVIDSDELTSQSLSADDAMGWLRDAASSSRH